MTSPALTIGSLPLSSSVVLAPMAGYTDLPFRLAVRRITPFQFLAFSEMLEPHSILRAGGKKRRALLAADPTDMPLAWQLYGTDPQLMAAAAQWLMAERRPAIIDINMGCPKRKVVARGAGAGLLRNPARAVEIARCVVAAVTVPVSVKLRLGWDAADTEAALRLAPALEDAGVSALIVHGRTVQQGYGGAVDLPAVARIVAAVKKIPVILSGDIVSPSAALDGRAATGCAGVMIGRAALFNPWLIQACARAFGETSSGVCSAPDFEMRSAFLRDHFQRFSTLHGERLAALLFRRWIPQYAKMLHIPRATMLAMLQTRLPSELAAGFSLVGIRLFD